MNEETWCLVGIAGFTLVFQVGRRDEMDELIAYCGLTCTECPGFLATQNDDDEARRKVAAEWSKEFNADIKPEAIDCDGCTVIDGRHIGYCGMCEIRKCGLERDVVNCAHCVDYACDKLEKFLAQVPAAREKLDGIRGGLA